mmetsp:Transcript_12203/g.27614  ORF Transcript_12203/g.27614 Transcript_12203/m.27614 type:complete len:143 (-) Transcript_12203:41-469(-)
MFAFQIARAGRMLPQATSLSMFAPAAVASQRLLSSVATSANNRTPTAVGRQGVLDTIAPVGLGSSIGTRNAGVSVLGCAIAMVAVGGCAQGIGQLFAALVVGMARNPSMKEDLFTYTLIGMGFLEFLAIVVILIAGLLLYSE